MKVIDCPLLDLSFQTKQVNDFDMMADAAVYVPQQAAVIVMVVVPYFTVSKIFKNYRDLYNVL